MPGHFYLCGRQIKREAVILRAQKIANILRSTGVVEGDAVALLLRNDVAYFELIEACRYLGVSYVPLNWHGTQLEIMHILNDSQSKVLIAHSDLLAQMSQPIPDTVTTFVIPTPPEIYAFYPTTDLSPKLSPTYRNLDVLVQKTDPIASGPMRFQGMFSYTSGSTGRPKGIRRVKDDNKPDTYLTYAGLSQTLMQMQTGDRFYVSAPLYHSAPNALSVCCLAAGDLDVYIQPKFSAESFLSDIETCQITHTYIVPTMMIRLLKLPANVRQKYDISSLRYAVSSGSAWPADVKKSMIEWFGPIFYESYGASEIGFMTLVSSEEALRKPGTVGKVLPGGSIKILDDNHQELGSHQSGEIFVYLPMFGPFSYTNDEGNQARQTYQDHTSVGDIGYLDTEGYLYINDRKKDMIISGGANIFPAEIEAQLIEMPEVTDCAIFGVPHPEFGEMTIAAIQCNHDVKVTLEQIHEFLDDKIARFKLPRAVIQPSSLPREDSGKIFKQRLREAYLSEHS